MDDTKTDKDEDIDEIKVIGDPLDLDDPFSFIPEPEFGLVSAHGGGKTNEEIGLEVCSSAAELDLAVCELGVENDINQKINKCKSEYTFNFNSEVLIKGRKGRLTRAALELATSTRDKGYQECNAEFQQPRNVNLAQCKVEFEARDLNCTFKQGL